MIEPYSGAAKSGLKKALGQLASVAKMADEDRYCMDLIQQNNAVIGLLQGVNRLILQSHLHTCGKALASNSAKTRNKFIAEIMRACEVSKRKG